MSKPMSFDAEKVSINLARLKKGGDTFEIVIDADNAVAYKEGSSDDVKDVLQAEHIYNDAKKGQLASELRLTAVFETTDVLAIAKTILDNGEIQFNQNYREAIRQRKRNKIINIILRNAVDPKTHLPHPRTRIENAFEEAKVRIDNFKRAEDQVHDVLKDLRVVLPIKFEIKEIAIKIPPEYAPKAYSTVERFGKILRDEWQTDGSWVCGVEIPAGIQNDFFDALNKLTQGSVETKILNTR